MTHEHHHADPALREYGGPEQDNTLPDATTIPVHDDVEDSLAPELTADLGD